MGAAGKVVVQGAATVAAGMEEALVVAKVAAAKVAELAVVSAEATAEAMVVVVMGVATVVVATEEALVVATVAVVMAAARAVEKVAVERVAARAAAARVAAARVVAARVGVARVAVRVEGKSACRSHRSLSPTCRRQSQPQDHRHHIPNR
jgi:hypothetical protein